ncbi:Uncharacterised protein [Mycobacteroides abscessus]|nr:Uncharacterised protein [Mycobacteroides abscessus]
MEVSRRRQQWRSTRSTNVGRLIDRGASCMLLTRNIVSVIAMSFRAAISILADHHAIRFHLTRWPKVALSGTELWSGAVILLCSHAVLMRLPTM